MESLKSLVSQISSANKAYSRGEPYLSDEEYHKLWKKLRDLDPSNPNLYHTSSDPSRPGEFRHLYPILSLQKAFDNHDLKVFFQRFQNDSFILQPKYDGVSIVLYRQSDSSVKAVLSGDGSYGYDVSWMLSYLDIPSFSGPSLQVEAIIPWKFWNPSFGSNPRNVVAGIFNPSRRDPSDLLSSVILQPHDDSEYSLSFGPYSEYDSLDLISDLFLETFYHFYQTFPIDGLVLKLNNSSKRLAVGHNRSFPHWAIAWKPPIQTAETRVVNIIYQVSRAGKIIPKIEYEPIELCGTINRFATANNMRWLISSGISFNSVITVGKAGEIIPKILELKSPSYPLEPLSHCPVCGTSLIWSGVHLICQGSSCVSQKIKSLSHFYGSFGVNLKSVGPKTLEEILSVKALRSILSDSPWALLDPEAFEISSLLFSVLGAARYQNYLDSLEKVSINPADFIAALGYPALGSRTSYKLVNSYRKKSNLPKNISSQAIDSFSHALEDLSRATGEFKSFKFSAMPEESSSSRYCITGELHIPRSEATQLLSSHGYQFSSSVTKNISFLILGHNGIGTSKYQKAEKYNIPIISYEEFFKSLNLL